MRVRGVDGVYMITTDNPLGLPADPVPESARAHKYFLRKEVVSWVVECWLLIDVNVCTKKQYIRKTKRGCDFAEPPKT